MVGRGHAPSLLVHRSLPQVTLIPTFDSVAMHEWYEETHARHQALGITVLGSDSTVSMQDEAFPACKVEF